MGLSITQLLIILAIIVLLFGTKKLRNVGGDVGNAIKNFKDSVRDENEDKKDNPDS
ncbi:MAG: twin-arginine translocase TatA/TatE family subunit [Pseudomonadota bacterium]